MSRLYIKEYKMTFPYGDIAHHQWIIIGRHGGKHLHISGYKPVRSEDIDFSGGLETHWRNPPEYMENCAPSQNNCWVLGQPCWHDGTSLYVSEAFIPRLKHGLTHGLTIDDHDWVFARLESEMRDTWPVLDEATHE